MSYTSRLWMVTSVAVVNTHSDQGAPAKLKSGLKSLNQGKNHFFSGSDAADLRSLSAVVGGFVGAGQRKLPEESLRQVMYLNCWAQG